MYNLIILGGNPGSGKTAVSKLLETRQYMRLGIDDFYQKTPRNPLVENWFEDREFLDAAYAHFKEEILMNLRQNKNLVIETTGVGNRWRDLLKDLESTFPDQLITIYLDASVETSLKRLQERNTTDYPIKMTEERLDAFLKLGKDTSHEYQHIIDANKPLNEVFDEVVSLLE